MSASLNDRIPIDTALAEAREMGFFDRFIIKGTGIRIPGKRKKYNPYDIAIVEQKAITMGKRRKGILCYTVSCEGELGVVVLKGRSGRVRRILKRALRK